MADDFSKRLSDEYLVAKQYDYYKLSETQFYSRENMAELERRITDVRSGKSTLKEHELLDVE